MYSIFFKNLHFVITYVIFHRFLKLTKALLSLFTNLYEKMVMILSTVFFVFIICLLYILIFSEYWQLCLKGSTIYELNLCFSGLLLKLLNWPRHIHVHLGGDNNAVKFSKTVFVIGNEDISNYNGELQIEQPFATSVSG